MSRFKFIMGGYKKKELVHHYSLDSKEVIF